MLKLWFELFFLLIILTVGVKSGFNIHKMAAQMRAMAIQKALEPFPPLPVMKNPPLP